MRSNHLHIYSRADGDETELFPSAQASWMGLETTPLWTPTPSFARFNIIAPWVVHSALKREQQRHEQAIASLCTNEFLSGPFLTHVNHCRKSNTVCMRQPFFISNHLLLKRRKEQQPDLKGTHAKEQWSYTCGRLKRLLLTKSNPWCITTYSPEPGLNTTPSVPAPLLLTLLTLRLLVCFCKYVQ